MRVKCDCCNCIANFNGECVVDECKGEIVMIPKGKNNPECRKFLYEVFAEDFRKEEVYGTENKA